MQAFVWEGRSARIMLPRWDVTTELAATHDFTADSRAGTDKDVADLLYRYGTGSVAVSLFASSGLAFVSIGRLPSTLLMVWWLLMTAVLILRGFDIFFHPSRISASNTAAREIRRFEIGLIAAALLWAAFPMAFLAELNQTGRAVYRYCPLRHGGRECHSFGSLPTPFARILQPSCIAGLD